MDDVKQFDNSQQIFDAFQNESDSKVAFQDEIEKKEKVLQNKKKKRKNSKDSKDTNKGKTKGKSKFPKKYHTEINEEEKSKMIEKIYFDNKDAFYDNMNDGINNEDIFDDYSDFNVNKNYNTYQNSITNDENENGVCDMNITSNK